MDNVLASFGDHIYVPEITFFGKYYRSPNGLYLIAVGRSLQDSSNRIVLFEGNEMLVNKRVDGVLHARICDTGLIVISRMKPSRGVRSQVSAMDKHGRNVMSLSLSTDVASLVVSRDGTFAACQINGSENSSCQSQLILMDIKAKRVMWTRDFSDRIERYCIDTESRELEVEFRHDKPVRYSFDGSLTRSCAASG